ncbi:hypothetical protein AB4K20DRAFT_1988113 [Rhizopus microsporus]
MDKVCDDKRIKTSKSVKAAWEQVVHLYENRNEMEARSFIAKGIDQHRDLEVIIGFKTIQQLLIAFRRYHQLLNPLHIKPPPEYDIAFKLWLPIFDCIFVEDPLLATRIAENRKRVHGYSKAVDICTHICYAQLIRCDLLRQESSLIDRKKDAMNISSKSAGVYRLFLSNHKSRIKFSDSFGKKKINTAKWDCFDSALICISINEVFHYRKLAIFDVMTMLFIKQT